MRISPIEIEQRQFPTTFRGLDPTEVQAFQTLCARELEDQIRENLALKEELQRQGNELATLKQNEAQLREVLLSAHKITEELRQAAEKEATLMHADAERQAARILQQAEDRQVALSQEVQALKMQKSRLRAEIQTILDAHRRLLETQAELDRELNDPDSASTNTPAPKSAPAATQQRPFSLLRKPVESSDRDK